MPPVVFIHGIKGATLKNPNGDTLWLTGFQALGMGRADLPLPLSWDALKGQPRDDLRATEPLPNVRVIPGLIQQQVYGPWLEAARKMAHPFVSFAYDWRRDNLESLEEFEQFVEKESRAHQGAKVRIVAHSMGGLLTMALLNRRPDLVHSVVFAGVPFAGGVGFLNDLHVGVKIGINRRILSPDLLFTFPSVFTLFPLDGHGLVDAAGLPISMDFFAAEDWHKQKLSVFQSGGSASEAPDTRLAVQYLESALAHAQQFRKLLAPRLKKVTYPPILVVASDTHPTLVTVMRDGPKSQGGWDFDSAERMPGDGRVALKDALPPTGVPYRLFKSQAEHSDLLSDPKVIQEIAKD